MNAILALESRIAALEADGAATSAPIAKKKKLESNPIASASGPATTPAAAPGPASAALPTGASEAQGGATWVEVVKKSGKPTYKVLTPEMIKASPDPMRLLLATERKSSATVEVMVTHAKLPLSIKAQSRPYLAWRTVLKRVTGLTPLNITLVHPRRGIIYWDVTDTPKKGKILAALDDAGFFLFPAEEGVVSDHHFLRAYKTGYFKLLRQSALAGLTAPSAKWVLDKAEEQWKKAPDRVLKHIWLRRIAWDKRALEDGVVVAAGVMPSLDPNWRPGGYMSPLDTTPRVTCLKWMCDYIYLHRERREAVYQARPVEAAPATDGVEMEAG